MATAALSAGTAVLRAAESRAVGRVGNGGWKFTGTGRDDNADSKVKAKTPLRNRIAVFLILLLMGGGAAFLGSSNSLLGAAMNENITLATDSQYGSSNYTFKRLMKMVLGKDVSVVTNKDGFSAYGRMSKKFRNRLSAQGIDIIEVNGSKAFSFKGETITADKWYSSLKSNKELLSAYNSAKRGRVATFFDNTAKKTYKRYSQSRNLWNDYRQTGDANADKSNFEGKMTSVFDGGDATFDAPRKETYEYDDNGEPKTGTRVEVESESTGSLKATVDPPEVKARNLITNFANKAGNVGSGICAFMKIGNMIAVAIAGLEMMHSIGYFMGFIENPSKTIAGLGSFSAINEMLNYMSIPATTFTTNFGDLKSFSDGSGQQGVSAGTVKQTGSPLEANGLQMMLAGAVALPSTTKLFSKERVSTAVGMMQGTTGSAGTCSGVDIASGVISIAVTIASFGTATIASMLLEFAGSVAIGIAAQLMLQFLIPTLAQTFFTNVFETVKGIPAGELMARGASEANQNLGRGGGLSLSNGDAANAYNKVTQEAILADAEVDRATHSPFDITNKNTFFGTIAWSLLPIAINSKTSGIASFIRTTAKSVSSLVSGGVRAEGEGSSYLTTYGNCPALEAIGAVGDIYCVPITSIDTDPEIMNITPGSTLWNTYEQTISDDLDCDEDGNCIPWKNSDLDKYINYCTARTSPFGVIDQNILAETQPSSIFGSAGSIVNGIPLIGDIFNIVDGASDLINLDWANGKKCGNTEDNSEWWGSNGRYYQRYVEDTRILTDMGAYEELGTTDPVTAALDRHEAEHPLDESRAGILARYSGLSKDNAETVLAIVDYYQYLNNYDPSARIAMNETTLSEKSGEQVALEIKSSRPYFESDLIVTPQEVIIVAKQDVVYNDLRNRSYVA